MKSLFFCFKIIYLAVPGLSYMEIFDLLVHELRYVSSSFKTRDGTWAPCMGSKES